MEQITDSVLYQHRQFDGTRRSIDWLRMGYNAYNRLRPFREKRKMCKDYAFGKQYEKKMCVNGRYMSKQEYLERMGLPAIQFNTLGKNKRVIQGQYRNNDVAPICHAADPAERQYADVLSELLKQNMKMNRRTEKDAKNFEEFLISGMPVYKVSYAMRRGKKDVWVDRVNPNLVFFPMTLEDDLEDVRFIGMLHAYDFSKVLSLFSHSPQDSKRLREVYAHCNSDDYIASTLSTDQRTYDISQTDFFKPNEYGKCRVIELWTKERREAYLVNDPLEANPYYVPYKAIEASHLREENERRMQANIKMGWDGVNPMTDEEGNIQYFQDPVRYEEENKIQWEYAVEEYWYFRYMAPDGTILEEGASPYWNGGESLQPFVVKPYPWIDGEIHSHTEEMIPAQDYLNYYIIALDFYLKNASKGVMMVDEESISEQQGFEEMCDQFIRTNGVVLYTSKKGGKAPTVQTSGSIPGGFDYFINLAKQMGEDVSGAQASLQGKKEGGSTSGVLFSQLVNQAATSLSDMMGTYNDFLEQVALKVVKMMQCCYSGVKSVSICGEPISVDMGMICDVDCDISINQNTNTATFRALNTDFLLSMAAQGKIPLKAAFEAGDIPGSERFIRIIEKYEQQALQQQQMQLAGGGQVIGAAT